MTVAQMMLATAVECVRKPGRKSIWSPRLQRYVCSDDPEFETILRESYAPAAVVPAIIDPTFKLVFLTAASGTIIFTLICVATTIATQGHPSSLVETLNNHLLDLAKVGFGAIVGLLGGKSIKAG